MRFNPTFLAALSLGLGACTYASPGLSDLECAPEGALEDTRECVDGIWVERGGDLDAGVDVPDEGVAELDAGSPDAGEDASCGPFLDAGSPDAGEDASCGPFDDDVLCAAAGFDCGTPRVGNMCGAEQAVFCGACPEGAR